MPEQVFSWIGYCGVAFYLGSYALLQSGVIRGGSYLYSAMNLLAALFVLVSLSVQFNLSSALIQVSWILISIVGLARLAYFHHSVTLTDAETSLAQAAFPSLPRVTVRRILDQGHWVTLVPGTVLTEEKEPVKTLSYLISGEVEVRVSGHRVATLTQGFIGEINILQGGPATATVVVQQPSWSFMVSQTALLSLIRRDMETRSLLLSDLRADTARKLLALNHEGLRTPR
jgi:hypothetical protein